MNHKQLLIGVFLICTSWFYSCKNEGCTEESACNYDSNASQDNGSCEYFSCLGCLDSAACNYDPEAKINKSCDYSCYGCTDERARNYDEFATLDNGNCDYRCTIRAEVHNFIVARYPSSGTNIKFEILVDGNLVMTSKPIYYNGSYTIVGADYVDFNIEANKKIIRFPENGGWMVVKLYENNEFIVSHEYSTCYILGILYDEQGNNIGSKRYSPCTDCVFSISGIGFENLLLNY